MEQPKRPVKLTPTEKEFLKLRISREMNKDPEFKAKVEKMVKEAKEKTSQSNSNS